jgi:pilus biogenesis lipoprotein CpaD
MAGMIQNSTKHNINGFPGLMELPILGPLFKSNDYINQQTELMVLVTPYIVRAVAQKDLSRPDDGFADPSDPAQVLLGRFNRIYGVGGTPIHPTITAANTASSLTDLPREETTMQIVRKTIAAAPRNRAGSQFAPRRRMRALRLRMQHRPAGRRRSRRPHRLPVAASDHAQRSRPHLEVFVGSSRGELNATQRAEVLAFAQTWRARSHRRRGGRSAGRHQQRARVGGGDARAIRSILAASGVPAERHRGARLSAAGAISRPSASPIRGSPRRPDPVRPVARRHRAEFNRNYFENQPVYNAGCATQRNLAAMVDNPADLVQPRAETPAYTMRRTTVVEKYRAGTTDRDAISPTIHPKSATLANDAV